ncbi:MAG: NACHT domain-containing protein, partial [Planktothrix sp.]
LVYLFWLDGRSKQREAESQLRQALLEGITQDVEKRRQDSLDNFYHIPLSGVQQSPASLGIFRPIQVVVGEKTRLLDVSISKLFFQEDVGGQLLILGEPGSGKTTELLGLAQTLCQRAQKDPQEPIPIIFELSDWRPSRQPIEADTLNHWMVEQLQLKYGLDPQLSQNWLHRNRLIPLLDGLDELKNFMPEAIRAINLMQEVKKEQHHKLIVCSRFEDYKDCPEKLSLRTKVKLKPLKNKKAIQDYLKHRDASHLWKVLKASPQGWLKLAQTPLLLDLMPRAYPAPLVSDCPNQAGEAACRRRLFEDYSHRQLTQEPNQGYSEEDSRRYLQQLAKILRRQGQTEFLIEEMQPDWLETPRQKRLFNWGSALIWGLILGLTGGLILGLTGGLILGLTGGLSGGLIVVLFLGLSGGLIEYDKNQIELTESFDFSWSNIRYVILSKINLFLIGWLVFWLHALWLWWSNGDEAYMFLLFIISMQIFMMVVFWILNFRAIIKVKKYPNQGIWQSLKSFWVVSLVTSPVWGGGFWLINLMMEIAGQNPFLKHPGEAVIWGLGLGLLIGAFFGGLLAVLLHGLLRLILYRQ